MSDLTDLTIADLRDGYATRQFSASDVTRAYLQRIDKAQVLNSYITVLADKAQEAASLADKRLKAKDETAMTGIPIGLKDLFCTSGVQTTAGSKILEGFRPTYDSFVSQRLQEDGAIILGKLNMDEFAMGSSSETSAFGPVISPWQSSKSSSQLVPGGSSGGSSAAVAARLCAGATGTDTGGSIRQPASFTGIVGMKPTYGRCSRWGIIAFASSLDQAGPMARTVRDCALMLQSMAGFDPRDSTSLDLPVPACESAMDHSLKNMRVGIPKEYRVEGMASEIEDLWQRGKDWLRDAGAEIVDITLPHTHQALPTYYIIAPAECSSNLSRYDGVRYGFRAQEHGDSLADLYAKTRAEGFGTEVKRRIMIGTYVLSAGYYDAYYLKAQQVRTKIVQDFNEAFRTCDLILAPTAPTAAFELGGKLGDPIAMFLNDVFTVPASLAGLPAISVPASLNGQGLPLGLQLIGKQMADEAVFTGAAALERAAGFTAQADDWWIKS